MRDAFGEVIDEGEQARLDAQQAQIDQLVELIRQWYLSHQGGSSGITIQAGTIIADDMSVKEFARRIDRELFGLSRNKETDSI